MKKSIQLFIIASLLILTSCQKSYKGDGGLSTIEGTLYKINHYDDSYNFDCDTTIATDEDVYIYYKDEDFYGDKCKTNASGKFRFQGLRLGNYTIYAYSENGLGTKIAEQKHLKIKIAQRLDIGNLYIHTGKCYQLGMLHGKVRAHYFNKESIVIDEDWAYGERVYIQHLNDNYYFDDTRVGADGSYYFNKLRPGTYVIYAYSQNIETHIPSPVYDTIHITTANTDVDGGIINIWLKA